MANPVKQVGRDCQKINCDTPYLGKAEREASKRLAGGEGCYVRKQKLYINAESVYNIHVRPQRQSYLGQRRDVHVMCFISRNFVFKRRALLA